jgi:hypothetical protein
VKESRIKTLLLVASWSFFAVIVVAFVVMPARVTNVTMGQLAMKEPPAPVGRVRITNGHGCILRGRHLVFLCPDPNRLTVVLAFPNAETATGTAFTGYCSGPVDHVVDGIPSDPPYVLVIDCQPVTVANP